MSIEITAMIENAGKTGEKKLDLSRQNLKTLPPSLFECDSLEFLNLSHNSLASLPSQMASLRNLQELWLFENELSSVPAVLAGLPALRTLWVYRNRIEEWPEIPDGWASLVELDIAVNHLRELPAHIARLPRLKRLIVSSNPLQYVSENLSSRGGLTMYIGRDQVKVLTPALLESYHFNTPPSRQEVQEYRFRRSQRIGDPSLVLEIKSKQPPEWVDDLSHVENLTIEQLTDDLIEVPELPRLRTVTITSGTEPNGRPYFLSVPASLERSSELEALTVSAYRPMVLPAFTACLPRLRCLSLQNGNRTKQLFHLKPLPSGCQEPPFGGLERLFIDGEPLPGFLRQCRQLKSLFLSADTPPEDLAEFIGSNPMLEVLDLAISHLEAVPETIAGLRHLQSLQLYSNRLTSLPEWIGSLVALRSLSLGSCENLETLPPLQQLNLDLLIAPGSEALQRAIEGSHRIGTLVVTSGEWNPRRFPEIEKLVLKGRCTGGQAPAGLKVLELALRGSDGVPDWLQDCTSLESLSLEISGRRVLPAWIGSLTKLRELHVHASDLRVLPEEIGALESLETLSIYGSLRTLPKTIGKLRNLKRLDLGGNRIGNALRKLPPLPNLESLGISWNGLRHLPSNLGEFTNLRHLNVSGNPLDFAKHSLERLTGLRSLDISSCGLVQLPAGIERLSKLETLNANDNQLEQLPEGFANLRELKTVNLGGNRLSEVAAHLSPLPNLEWITIGGNGIHSLPLPLYAISDMGDSWRMWAPTPVDRSFANVMLADASMSSPYVVC